MLYKVILFLLMSSPMFAMEINGDPILIDIDDTEVFLIKVSAILKDQELTTQSIIKDLLIKDSGKKSSPEQREQKLVIIRKITDSDK